MLPCFQVNNLCDGGEDFAAACGGVTRMTSLVPGCERVEPCLPYTDRARDRPFAPPDRCDAPEADTPKRAPKQGSRPLRQGSVARLPLADSARDVPPEADSPKRAPGGAGARHSYPKSSIQACLHSMPG